MVKKIITIIILLVVVGGAGWWLYKTSSEPTVSGTGEITSFEECVAKGYPVMESYPRQCKTPEGGTFIEDIGNVAEKIDLIRIDTPRPNDLIESPLLIEGQARGSWFFEADFPVELLDGNGNVIATAIASTQEEWMTEDFVAFTAELEFTIPQTNKGNLILKKDNPSDLPEHDDKLRVPVRFK